MTYRLRLTALASMALMAGAAQAGVTPEEAKQLGTTLTLFGAEKAGNKEGTIPAYTGGLPASTSPPGFKKDSGKWVSPFAAEKPLYSITAANMDKYADKLSEGQKYLLKRYPSYRMDVYTTHRTANYPQSHLEKTQRNAINARTSEGGLKMEGAVGGIPFPIPKTGYEAMWNHLSRWLGVASTYRMRNYYVDTTGRRIYAGEVNFSQDHPFQGPKATAESVKGDDMFVTRSAVHFTGPSRNVGEAQTWFDTIDPVVKPRRAHVYSPSTRRVRLAPDIAYDTPIASAGGVMTYDDGWMFTGKMDRFDFKLLGKKEIYLPYSTYDAIFQAKTDKLLMANHENPSVMRWELHRVWVVEATLKPGLRHVYSKRVIYLDEDWTGAGVADMYDGAGKIYKGFYLAMTQLYDKQVPWSIGSVEYDFSTGLYTATTLFGETDDTTLHIHDALHPKTTFSADSLPARSGR
ncbi:DUF1329 domain-containing protein [Massilia cavernae]|nr:DUF1329 domain-containing protein [Massilia cavernae]